jgi:hypothetical protein
MWRNEGDRDVEGRCHHQDLSLISASAAVMLQWPDEVMCIIIKL